MNHSKKRNPWAWVPTLYMAEGLPNVIVTIVAATLLMDRGFSDTQIAFYIGWLQQPWIFKFLWSPFVDLYKTKRWWVLLMQVLIGSAFAGVAFVLPYDFWLQAFLCLLLLISFSSATHDIAADGFYMLELDEHKQALFVGIRNTFYRLAVIFGKGVLIPIAGLLQRLMPGNETFAWSLLFYGMAGLFLAIWLYHTKIMPKPLTDKQHSTSARDVARGMVESCKAFFTKLPLKQTIITLSFLLLYRLPEAVMSTLSVTFLQRPHEQGGLGLTKEEFGLANGTVGMLGLLAGGVLGGILASRDGLKRWLWPMVLAFTVPDALYVYLSYAQPDSLFIISASLFIEQFGFGLGFTALTLYMLYFSQGQFQTSHYALCTGIIYLGWVLPGMFAGYLKDAVGYTNFFLIVMALCSITFLVTALIKIDPEFGKKKQE